jgi:hypothetical protein
VAHVRRVLTFMIAAAVALGPAGSAMAASRVLHVVPAQAMQAQPDQTHIGHDEHGTLPVATSENDAAAARCDGMNSGDCCCCDHKANCAGTCLQKCFGQLGLIPPDRSARTRISNRLVAPALKRPPDWCRDPQTPPPRA